MDFILQNPWLVIVAILVSFFVTLIWRAYVEYKWPFHKMRRQ